MVTGIDLDAMGGGGGGGPKKKGGFPDPDRYKKKEEDHGHGDCSGHDHGSENKVAQEAEAKAKREADLKKAREEEERRKQEEAEKNIPPEEREKLIAKRNAETKKNEGNTAYKNKQFEAALALYDEAISLDSTELTYYTNKAAVFFEMKEWDKCIEECDKAIAKSKEGYYDYVKLSKALGRKGNAMLAKGDCTGAIELYQQALLENNDPSIKDQLKKAEKQLKEEEARKYLDPAKAEEHKTKGNEYFAAGDYPNAVKEFTEGLKRDPSNKGIYSNRSAAYIKLMEFPSALKDAEKCLELDPNFVKAYFRKGTIHHLNKEFHKALQAYDAGLKIEPTNKDCLEGKQKTMVAIQASMHEKGDETQVKQAMQDPEI